MSSPWQVKQQLSVCPAPEGYRRDVNGRERPMGYHCGSDIGGTFTDRVVIDDEEIVSNRRLPTSVRAFSMRSPRQLELRLDQFPEQTHLRSRVGDGGGSEVGGRVQRNSRATCWEPCNQPDGCS
jgi:hypothetical protein